MVRQVRLPPGETDQLAEITELTRSAGADVVGGMYAVRSRPVAATFIGKGKVEELADMVADTGATLVVFDHAISPIQERNIERAVQCRVLDRSGLILDIFAQRATTSEGKLQVELAQLRHLSTRLVRGWTHLERQKGGIGLRGPGESQLETDRRLIGVRIRTLSGRLEKLRSQRTLRRRGRERTPIPTVSLVGYTNAGKSSIFRALTGSDVLVEDKLFATLDPTMRRIELPGFGPVVLSDTVGFVRDLPHSLVAAFHSTLEEVSSADCLLMVSDVSDPDHAELECHVHTVLGEIGASDIPTIQVYNKIDLAGEAPRERGNGSGLVDRVWVSAEKRQGMEMLVTAVGALLSRDHRTHVLELSPEAGALRSALFEKCDVISEEICDDGRMRLSLRTAEAVMGWLRVQERFRGQWSMID